MEKPIYGIWNQTPYHTGWWCKGDGEAFHTEHYEVALAQLATVGKSHQIYGGGVQNSIRRIDEWAIEGHEYIMLGNGDDGYFIPREFAEYLLENKLLPEDWQILWPL